VTAKEVANKALDDDEYGYELKDNVTTDTSYDSEPDFDSSDNDEFNPILSSDYNAADNNIEVN
jgi:hypothetical protein